MASTGTGDGQLFGVPFELLRKHLRVVLEVFVKYALRRQITPHSSEMTKRSNLTSKQDASKPATVPAMRSLYRSRKRSIMMTLLMIVWYNHLARIIVERHLFGVAALPRCDSSVSEVVKKALKTGRFCVTAIAQFLVA
jgi:hypothetical protein